MLPALLMAMAGVANAHDWPFARFASAGWAGLAFRRSARKRAKLRRRGCIIR